MLVVIARYWNEAEWIDASIQQIEMWGADQVWISEGCWDQRAFARSIDGTIETLSKAIDTHEGWRLFCADRESLDYRTNQAATSEKIMHLAGCKPGDWIVTVDADHFFWPQDIEMAKKLVAKRGHEFDYMLGGMYAFLVNLETCEEVPVRRANYLPYKVLPGAHWIATNHLAIGNLQYESLDEVRPFYPNIMAQHFEGMHSPERLQRRYSLGDRKTPWQVGRLRKLRPWGCPDWHPEYVKPTLRKLGWLKDD